MPENVQVVCSDGIEREVDDAPMGACHLVMTHSHALDFDLSLRILRRADFRYFGLIGSATKRRSFEHRLLARDAVTGHFRFRLGIERSAGMTDWTQLTGFAATVNPTNGLIDVDVTPDGTTPAFYRLMGTKP